MLSKGLGVEKRACFSFLKNSGMSCFAVVVSLSRLSRTQPEWSQNLGIFGAPRGRTGAAGSSCQICLGSLGKRHLCCPSVESQMLVPGCRSCFSSHSLYLIPQGGEMRLWNSGMFGAGCCCRQCCSRLLGLVNGIGVVRSCSFCHCSFSFQTPQATNPARHSPLTAGESAAPGSHPDTDP